jgi:hypothetical protein
MKQYLLNILQKMYYYKLDIALIKLLNQAFELTILLG